mmetsp:Transcript_103320/g.178055  ORF Transcript_103320/g.178055 Transcript_103320/m.178055 type:complete len:262 (-) Transcript_103320:1234-2019(-)
MSDPQFDPYALPRYTPYPSPSPRSSNTSQQSHPEPNTNGQQQTTRTGQVGKGTQPPHKGAPTQGKSKVIGKGKGTGEGTEEGIPTPSSPHPPIISQATIPIPGSAPLPAPPPVMSTTSSLTTAVPLAVHVTPAIPPAAVPITPVFPAEPPAPVQLPNPDWLSELLSPEQFMGGGGEAQTEPGDRQQLGEEVKDRLRSMLAVGLSTAYHWSVRPEGGAGTPHPDPHLVSPQATIFDGLAVCPRRELVEHMWRVLKIHTSCVY